MEIIHTVLCRGALGSCALCSYVSPRRSNTVSPTVGTGAADKPQLHYLHKGLEINCIRQYNEYNEFEFCAAWPRSHRPDSNVICLP